MIADIQTPPFSIFRCFLRLIKALSTAKVLESLIVTFKSILASAGSVLSYQITPTVLGKIITIINITV